MFESVDSEMFFVYMMIVFLIYMLKQSIDSRRCRKCGEILTRYSPSHIGTCPSQMMTRES